MAPGAGRKKGKVSKAKRELAEMAKEHAEDALLTLVEIAKGNSAASARVPAKFLNLLDFLGSGGGT